MAKVRFGLSNVYISKLTESDSGYTWAVPVAMPGAVSITLDAEGDQNTFYADNMAYYVTSTNNGYTGELEMALYPDWFLEEYLGYVKDTSGNLIEDASVTVGTFAMLFQFENDVKNTRHCLYKVTPSRPSIEGETTEDSSEPQTETMDITISPITVDGHKFVKKKTTEETEETDYNAWFTDAPAVPTLA